MDASGCIFGVISVVIDRFLFGTFPDFVKNGAPRANAVNSDWIEGRAPRKSTNKLSETEEKTAGKRRRKNNGFWVDFGSMLGGVRVHFAS